MTDSEPPDHDIEARLIRAGIREKPPSATLQRTLAGLGLGASTIATVSSAGALGAAKAVAPITVFGLTKWASLGAVSGIVLSAATYGAHHATRPATQPAPSSPAVPNASAPVVPANSALAREPVIVEPPPTLALPDAPSPSPRPAPAAEMDLPLATEVAFVDRAREAFQRNEPGAAIALLDGYERSFPERRLMPEVIYLRMRAHRQLGDTERAAQLAERLLRNFPNSPHVWSARSLLQDTSGR